MKSQPTQDGAGTLLFCLAILAAIIPILSVNVAPLCDFPNHLGRIHILANYNVDRLWSDFYLRDLAVLPNLAMDVLATPLAHVLGTRLAGSVFLLLTVLLFVIGAAAVARAQRQSAAIAALLAACCIHTVSFEYGFVNYMFGLGWMMVALAAWITARRAAPWMRVLISVPFALVLFFSHLMPLAFYAIAVFAHELGRIQTNRRGWGRHAIESLGVAGVQFLVPALLYFLSPTSAETNSWTMLSAWKKLFQLGSVFSVGDGNSDVIFAVCFGVAILALIGFGRARLDRAGWITLAGMFAVFAVAPQKTATADNISIRVPTAILLLVVALARFEFRGAQHRAVALGILATLLIGRTMQVTTKWTREAPVYDSLAEAFGELPAGTTLFTLRDVPNRVDIRGSWRPPMAHAAGLALLETPLFLPQLFANHGQQPLIVLSPTLLAMRAPRGDFMPTYANAAEFASWIDTFAELQSDRKLPKQSPARTQPASVLHVHDGAIDDLSTEWLERVASGDRWTLWLITK